jgi:hypothetical protein
MQKKIIVRLIFIIPVFFSCTDINASSAFVYGISAGGFEVSPPNKKLTYFGFKGGLNRSVINGKELNGTATGYIGLEFYAAFFAETVLNEKWKFENEILFSFTDEYHFLEIPVHLKHPLFKNIFAFAGPKLDIIIDKDNDFYDFKNFGLSLELGLQYEITRRIISEIRYSNGLSPQVNDFVLDIYDGKRNTLRFGLGFKF